MTTPAGWYPDTEVPGGLRYWDGTVWTEHRTPPPGAPAEPAQESAQPPAEYNFSEQPTSIVKLPPEGATTVIPTVTPPAEPTPEASPEPESTPEATPVADAAPAADAGPAADAAPAPEAAPDPVFPSSWETPPMPSWDSPAAEAQPSSETQMAPTVDPPVTPSYEPPTATYETPAYPASTPASTPPAGYGPPPTTPPPGYGPPSSPPADASYGASYPPPPGFPPDYSSGAPGGGGGNNNKLILIIGGAIAAVVLVAALVLSYFFVIKKDDKTESASASTSQSKASKSETTETSESETTTAETTAAAPPGGEVTDGPFSFRVTNVDTYDTIESSDVDGLEVAADGVFLIVELDVTNTSGSSSSFLLTQQTLNANGQSIRTDDEGNFYANGNVAFEIQPGETLDVAVAFDVPDGTTADSIHVYGDIMSAGVDLPLS